MKFYTTGFVLLLITASISARDIIFLGISAHNAPAIGQSLEKQLRDQLNVSPGIRLIEDSQTQRFLYQLNFDINPVLSKEQFQPLLMYHYDSTMIIWGTIKECTIKAYRRNLIKSALRGKLVLGLNVYSLDNQKYVYIGFIESEVNEPKGWILFESIENGVHISSEDRLRILSRLQGDAVQSSFRILKALLYEKTSKELEIEIEPQIAPLEKSVEPSISDVFSIPSIEAAPLDSNLEGGKNDTIGQK